MHPVVPFAGKEGETVSICKRRERKDDGHNDIKEALCAKLSTHGSTKKQSKHYFALCFPRSLMEGVGLDAKHGLNTVSVGGRSM